MYWYLRRPEDNPRLIAENIRVLLESYVCPECKGDVKKIKFTPSNQIGLYCPACNYKLYFHECKSKFESLEDDKRVELSKVLQIYDQAKGKHFFEPNEKEFWYFLNAHKTFGGISGGNRSGKSATNAIDIVMRAEGWHPLQRHNLEKMVNEALDERVRDHCYELLSRGLWIKSPPVQIRVVAVDFPNGVEKIIGPEIKKWATIADVKDFGFMNEKKRRDTWKNGSFVEYMSTDQDLDSHGGSARDYIYIDEECPQEYWTENMMRIISTRGQMRMGATAVNGVTWTENEIWIPGEEGDPDFFTMEMSTYDNPTNTPEMIDKIMRQCRDEVDIAIRIYGKRTLRGGHVYKMYREEYPWVIDPFEIPKDKGVLIMAIDTHPAIPHAVLWIWADYDDDIDENGNHLRFSLIDNKPNLYEVHSVFEGGTIPELVKLIRNEELTNPYLRGRQHDICIADPSIWASDQTKENKKSLYEQFVDEDIHPIPGSKKLTAKVESEGGLYKVGELLTLNEEHGHPRLMTFRKVEGVNFFPYNDKLKMKRQDYLLKEKRGYHFPDPRKALKQGRTAPQKPVDKDDHLMEDERRICEYVWDFIATSEDLENTIIAPDGNVVQMPEREEDEEEFEGVEI